MALTKVKPGDGRKAIHPNRVAIKSGESLDLDNPWYRRQLNSGDLVLIVEAPQRSKNNAD